MAITEILLETRIGERLSVAFSGDTPLAIFHESDWIPRGLRLGTSHEVILRERPAGLDGAFCETESGASVFVRLGKAKAPPTGARLRVEIVCEARKSKAARGRVRAEADETSPATAFEAWKAHIAPGATITFAEGAEDWARIDGALETALLSKVTLPGGGRLSVARTPALTAFDIDTAGRPMRGPRGEAATSLNIEAAKEMARQMALRGLGGLAVLDCVAPVPKPSGGDIKAAFLAAFRDLSPRKAAALAPSPFGLMEVSLAWAETPIDEVLGNGEGGFSPAGEALRGLRLLERRVKTAPCVSAGLALPKAAYMAADERPGGIAAIEALYGMQLGPRVLLEINPDGRTEVTCS
ncbi:MAG: ribonuclease E/G [Pseudomonadota bacterium]